MYDAWILILCTLLVIIFYIACTTTLTQIIPGTNLNMLHCSLKVKSSNMLTYRKKYLRVWLPRPIPPFFYSPFSATTGQHFWEFFCSNQPSPVLFMPLLLLSLIPCIHGNWGYPCTTWILAQSEFSDSKHSTKIQLVLAIKLANLIICVITMIKLYLLITWIE